MHKIGGSDTSKVGKGATQGGAVGILLVPRRRLCALSNA
jgi:hypothetical protein